MTNKTSFGIKVYGIISLIFSFIILFLVVIPSLYSPNMSTLAYFISALGWMIFGIGVLKHYSGARIGLMALSVIYIVDTFEQPSHLLLTIRNQPITGLTILITSLTFFLSLLFFFARPSVKQEFIKNDGKSDQRSL